MSGQVDRVCFAAGVVAGEGSFQDGEGKSAKVCVGEDLAEVGWFAEDDSGECFQETVGFGVQREDVETIPENVIEFVEARIVLGYEETDIGVMGGLEGRNGMKRKGRGNLFGYER